MTLIFAFVKFKERVLYIFDLILADKMGSFDGRLIGLGAIIFGIIALVIVIVIPISFSYLDYYHYGFQRRYTTGRVRLDRVYEGGRYFTGPDIQ